MHGRWWCFLAATVLWGCPAPAPPDGGIDGGRGYVRWGALSCGQQALLLPIQTLVLSGH